MTNTKKNLNKKTSESSVVPRTFAGAWKKKSYVCHVYCARSALETRQKSPTAVCSEDAVQTALGRMPGRNVCESCDRWVYHMQTKAKEGRSTNQKHSCETSGRTAMLFLLESLGWNQDWNEWTTCSSSCGDGNRVRHFRIAAGRRVELEHRVNTGHRGRWSVETTSASTDLAVSSFVAAFAEETKMQTPWRKDRELLILWRFRFVADEAPWQSIFDLLKDTGAHISVSMNGKVWPALLHPLPWFAL